MYEMMKNATSWLAIYTPYIVTKSVGTLCYLHTGSREPSARYKRNRLTLSLCHNGKYLITKHIRACGASEFRLMHFIFEACDSIIGRLSNLPNMEKELIEQGYSEEKASEIIKELEPEATEALEKMKSLVKRWQELGL